MTAARARRAATLPALAAIALWAGLAWLGVRLSAVPPFLLVGSALTIAGALASPTWRSWRTTPQVLALGIYGLFGFHFFLFVALRLAPPLPANVVNYLWPLLIVLLAPLFLRDARLTRAHVTGGLLGLAGAIVAITNGRLPDLSTSPDRDAMLGYGAALVSAFIWATYSLQSQRFRRNGVIYPTSTIGAFCLASGLLALGCHAALEPAYRFRAEDIAPLLALAIGPMGAAFFLWDAALRRGDPRAIGTLAYLTPVLSTLLLATDDPSRLGWPIAVALVLVIAGAVVGTRSSP
jgi:drug/metabolite transporter (DMT)-like permease